MNTRSYTFYETASIPGIPGSWNAGQVITIDTDTNTVLSVDLRDKPPVIEDVPTPEPAPQAKFSVDPPQPIGESSPVPSQEEIVPIEERPSQQEG